VQGSEGTVIVNLAVHDENSPLLRLKGLLAGGQIKYGKTSVGEAEKVIHPDIALIRAAVMLESIHA